MHFIFIPMLALFLSILASVSLFILFRIFPKFQIHTFHAITVNYVVCVITGVAFVDTSTLTSFNPSNWWFMALFLGSMFISTFYLMGTATQKVGVTVTTVSSKMSMVIPVLVNLFIFQSTKEFDIWNVMGLVIALISIILSNMKEENEDSTQKNNTNLPASPKTSNRFILPISIFILGGIIDTSISYSNIHLIQKGEEGIFPILLFATAGTIGLCIIIYQLITKQEKFELKSIYAGIILGIPNYFSIYFLFKALTAFDGNGAFVLPVINIGIIVVATTFAAIFMGDKLTKTNIVGVAMAILAIILLSYQKIIEFVVK